MAVPISVQSIIFNNRCRDAPYPGRAAALPGYGASLHLLSPQLRHELLEDVCMPIDIILGVLDGDRPLVIKSRREEDAAIRQEEPVRVRELHVDISPIPEVPCPLITEHSAPLCANLGNMHRHIKLFDDSDVRVC